MSSPPDLLFWELAIDFVVMTLLVISYRKLFVYYLELTTLDLVFTGTITFIFLVLAGGFGRDYGVPALFWHEDWQSRLAAATAVTLLFVEGCLAASYLDPEQEDTRIRFQYFYDSWPAALVAKLRWRELASGERYPIGRIAIVLPTLLPLSALVAIRAFFVCLAEFREDGLEAIGKLAAWYWGMALGFVMAAALRGVGVWLSERIGRRAAGRAYKPSPRSGQDIDVLDLELRSTTRFIPFLYAGVDWAVRKFPWMFLGRSEWSSRDHEPPEEAVLRKVDSLSSIVSFLIVVASFFLAMAFPLYRWVSPAVAICMLLGLIVMAYAVVACFTPPGASWRLSGSSRSCLLRTRASTSGCLMDLAPIIPTTEGAPSTWSVIRMRLSKVEHRWESTRLPTTQR
jgi:hypothetical protein